MRVMPLAFLLTVSALSLAVIATSQTLGQALGHTLSLAFAAL